VYLYFYDNIDETCYTVICKYKLDIDRAKLRASVATCQIDKPERKLD